MLIVNSEPKNITGVRAAGTMILVEMLTPQEAMGTKLALGVNAKPSAPQGYIVDIGPAIKADEWGIKVGDRVLLQGTYVPVPYSNGQREFGVVMPHDIKCVLQED